VVRCAETSEPEILGSVRFQEQIRQALLLLKTKDAEAYAIVARYVRRIQEGERSGMWAYKDPPTYENQRHHGLLLVTWCAATIAHDSFHSKLYHDYRKAHGAPVPDEVWTGTAAEQECMRHQLAVMQHLGTPAREIDYARRQAEGHYVKDKEKWEDCRKREVVDRTRRVAGRNVRRVAWTRPALAGHGEAWKSCRQPPRWRSVAG